jgi:hypothetical protein
VLSQLDQLEWKESQVIVRMSHNFREEKTLVTVSQ